jgi:phosphoglycerol transferase MdoB-like AlkP superfamily enzyme
VSGVALQVGLWLGLYTWLRNLHAHRGVGEANPARRASRRLALGILLAFVSTWVLMHLLAPRLAPAAWWDFFYLHWFGPIGLAALWWAALLPAETGRLLRSAAANPVTVPLPQLAILLVAAAVLASAGDLAFEWGGSSSTAIRLKEEVIEPASWAWTTLILFSASAGVFALTRRVTTALLLVSPLYIVLGLASLAKIEYMHSGVQPLDLLKIPEFLPLFRSFFGTGAVVMIAAALLLWIGALVAARRFPPSVMSPWRRWGTGLLALGFLVAVFTGFYQSETNLSVKTLLLRLGAPNSQHREQARLHGFLLSFLSQLPAASVTTPPNYSAATIASVMGRYPAPDSGAAPPGTVPANPRVNLVIYLIESFMDPNDLGYHYTADPIPNFRALSRTHSSGFAYVPERFGGSANTEFELLTGMTRRFLPDGSVAYRQYLRQPIPSLPRTLNSLGYATTAIQADPKYYYDRERVYDLLGFQRTVWLHSAPGVEHAARGAWPADMAVVRSVIEASRAGRPFFAFAFPSSTHSPYHFGVYEQSGLTLRDPPAGDAAGEVKEYVNAVRVADQALGALIEYFQHRPEPTIIAVLGDHLPPLSKDAYRILLSSLPSLPQAEQARRTHQVPLLVWSNFELPREAVQLSTSALPSYLLTRMGIPLSGFLAVTDAVRRRVPVLTGYDGGEERMLLEDYRLVQHDLLFGHQYLLGGKGPR